MRIAHIQTISKNKNENQASCCIEKRRNGFEDRTYPNHFQKQKRKSGVSFRSWIQNCKKKVFSPKTLKQCHMTKIYSGKGAICTIQLLSTTCWKATLNIFIPDENITIWYECCFRWAVPLTGGVYLPVGVVTLHNSSLPHWGRVPYCDRVPYRGRAWHQTRQSLFQMMACRLIGAEPLPEPMLEMVTSGKQCKWNFNRK